MTKRNPTGPTKATRWLALPVAVSLFCAAASIGRTAWPEFNEALRYDRAAIAAGQWWRLITAHVAHLNAMHAAFNIAGLLIVALIFADVFSSRRQAGALLVAAVAVDLGLWLAHPEIGDYVGLSGALHGLFAAGALTWAIAGDHAESRVHRAWGVALLVGLVAKLALEAQGHDFWLGASGIHVVIAAHRWGASGGLAFALLLNARFAWRALRPSDAARRERNRE